MTHRSVQEKIACSCAVSVLLGVLLGSILGCGDNVAVAQEKLRAADSPFVRAAAAERLGELDGDEAIRALTLFGLRDTAPVVRAAAARALAGKGHPQVIDLLGETLMDPDADVKRAAADSLAASRGEKARRYLELGYARSGSDGRPIMAEAIVKSGASPRKVVEEMAQRRMARALASLQSGAQAERIGAVRELGRAGTPDAVNTLMIQLGGRSVPLAAAAATALGETGHHGAVPPLIEALSEPHPTMRLAVLEALGRLGEPSTAPRILPFALGERIEVALAAVDALAMFDHDEQREEALCSVALGSNQPEIVVRSVRALETDVALDCDLRSRLTGELEKDTGNPSIGLALIEATEGSLLDEEGRERLRMLLSHQDMTIRAHALSAARHAGLEDVQEEVKAALEAMVRADQQARERWVSAPLPASFGWGDDGGLRQPSHEAAAVSQLEQAGLTATARRSHRFDELMERVADYRADVETRRRAELGLDAKDPEEARARHREALFGESYSSRLRLLSGPSPQETSLLVALARNALPLVGHDVAEMVASLVEHPEPEVRLAAIESMEALSSPELEAALLSALHEEQAPSVLIAASIALANRRKGKEGVLGALRWAAPEAQRGMVEAAVIYGDEDAVEALVGLLDGPVVIEAIRALQSMDGEHAVRALSKHLQAPDPPGLVEILTKPPDGLAGEEINAVARRALHSDWPAARAAAVRHLRRMGVSDPWLEAMRVDFDADVRAAAAEEDTGEG